MTLIQRWQDIDDAEIIKEMQMLFKNIPNAVYLFTVDENCSAENIGRKLKQLLENKRWVDFFCRDERDCYVCYCQTDRELRKESEMYDMQYVSSVYNEELALQIIKEFIQTNAKETAEWLKSSEKTQTVVYVGDRSVGIVKMREDVGFTPVFTALVTLRKSLCSNKNRSGFYVESIIPIPELHI